MKHYIIVKFKDIINAKKEVGAIEKLFHTALNIQGIDDIKIYNSNIDLPNRYDLMIKMTLTKSALIEFDHSEIHQQWKSEYGQLIENKAIFDCDE